MCLLLLLTGCIPKRVNWSPNGNRAAVIGHNGALYLCAADGTLTGPVIESGVGQVEWLSGTQQLAVVMHIANATAEQIEQLVPPEARPDEWPETVDLQALHIATLNGNTLSLGPPRTAMVTIHAVRPSPDGRMVALTGDDKNKSMTLWVTSVDGDSAPRRVEQSVAAYPDWSADGRSMIYAAPVHDNNDLSLAIITQRTVRDTDGALLASFDETKELAGTLGQVTTRIRRTSDGRLIFNAMEISLPVATRDIDENLQFFAIDPNRQTTLTRLVPRPVEPHIDGWAFLYEVSPDGKRIAFPDENGRIGIFTIATGEWVWAQDVEDDKDLRTVPVWRSATELCFAAPTQAGERKAQIVLYDVETKTSRVISADWPDDAVKGFLAE